MSKGWCYTLNNWTMDDVHRLRALHLNRSCVDAYHIFQPERGDGDTPHLQGFVYFKNRKRFSTVKRLIGQRAHLEPMRGTPQQASDYCSKEDSRDTTAGFGVHEVGDCPQLEPGKRNDLLEVSKRLDDGGHLWDIARTSEDLRTTVLRNHRALGMYETHVTGQRSHPTALEIHEGDPGTFKSFTASQWPDAYYLENGNSGAWFDGYEPNRHDTVVADEFGGHFMPYTTLKRLADRYPMSVETKGGRVVFTAKRLIITSNIEPEQWYKNAPFPELKRRITNWFKYTKCEHGIRGIHAGSIVIKCVKGSFGLHPLFNYLSEHIDLEEDERLLLKDDLLDRIRNTAPTQPVNEVPFLSFARDGEY